MNRWFDTVKQWALATIRTISGAIVSTSPPANASLNPPPVPLMLTGDGTFGGDRLLADGRIDERPLGAVPDRDNRLVLLLGRRRRELGQHLRPRLRGYRGWLFRPRLKSLAYLDDGQTGPSRPKNPFRITKAGRTSTAAGVLRSDDVSGLVLTDANHGLAIYDHFYGLASTNLVRTSDGGARWSRATSFFERL